MTRLGSVSTGPSTVPTETPRGRLFHTGAAAGGSLLPDWEQPFPGSPLSLGGESTLVFSIVQVLRIHLGKQRKVHVRDTRESPALPRAGVHPVAHVLEQLSARREREEEL